MTLDDLNDPELREAIRTADVVRSIHPETGKQVGLFYGAATLARIARRGTGEHLKTLDVPIDVDTQDVETLYALVEHIRGACC
jgi:hypothetical protein